MPGGTRRLPWRPSEETQGQSWNIKTCWRRPTPVGLKPKLLLWYQRADDRCDWQARASTFDPSRVSILAAGFFLLLGWRHKGGGGGGGGGSCIGENSQMSQETAQDFIPSTDHSIDSLWEERRFASCVTWESGWTYQRSNNPSADRLTNLIEKIRSCLFLQSAAQTLINRSGIKEIIPKSTRFTVFLVDMRSSRFPWAVSEYCFLIYFQFSISPWWSDLSLLELNTLIVSPWNSLVEVSTNRL